MKLSVIVAVMMLWSIKSAESENFSSESFQSHIMNTLINGYRSLIGVKDEARGAAAVVGSYIVNYNIKKTKKTKRTKKPNRNSRPTKTTKKPQTTSWKHCTYYSYYYQGVQYFYYDCPY
ncbi:CLUMA_CG016005, isoform A [Clunio marinus]|uniref:CLUMA_CG016005, isoform A n=1 Tax=Clunio marinus TaxID=568069 RepID=A0A1J1IVL3_9DIPT|nr:CLUMA_CG016005, isoform A [Clunio marinus]